MKNRLLVFTIPLLALLMALLVTGCTELFERRAVQSNARSSVVDYLYPKNEQVKIETSTPVLRLPLSVGVAFVPEQLERKERSRLWWGKTAELALTETKKSELLDRVATHFKKYEFVSDIEVIPSAYLTPQGSFANLEQIQTMYGIDVIALVSYDQVQFTDEDALSLTYWTLVGAYIFQGEKNDTSTMMDTAVYDIASRKMLFRAPGTSNIKGRSTPVNLTEELRKDSVMSFEEATTDMIANLDQQLERFREKIKQSPQKAKVVHRPGYSGGGFTGLNELLIMLLLLVTMRYRRERSVQTQNNTGLRHGQR